MSHPSGLQTCPDFKCVKSLTKCDVRDFESPTDGVVPIGFTVSEADVNSNLVMGVFTTKSYVGQILLPAGMLKVGWSVNITEAVPLTKRDDCGEVIQQTTSPGIRSRRSVVRVMPTHTPVMFLLHQYLISWCKTLKVEKSLSRTCVLPFKSKLLERQIPSNKYLLVD